MSTSLALDDTDASVTQAPVSWTYDYDLYTSCLPQSSDSDGAGETDSSNLVEDRTADELLRLALEATDGHPFLDMHEQALARGADRRRARDCALIVLLQGTAVPAADRVRGFSALLAEADRYRAAHGGAAQQEQWRQARAGLCEALRSGDATAVQRAFSLARPFNTEVGARAGEQERQQRQAALIQGLRASGRLFL